MHKEVGIEFELFRRNGANVQTYVAMAGLFHPVRYPLTYSLKKREQMAVNSSNPRGLQYLAFDLLLEGEKDKARGYLERARDIHLVARVMEGKSDERSPVVGIQRVLDNLDNIQELIMRCKEDILRERTERFLSRG